MDKQKVEFIESYIKIGNGDYEWNDNHGELIRCKDCKHGGCRTTYTDGRLAKVVCKLHGTKKNEVWMDADWFCADGEKLE